MRLKNTSILDDSLNSLVIKGARSSLQSYRGQLKLPTPYSEEAVGQLVKEAMDEYTKSNVVPDKPQTSPEPVFQKTNVIVSEETHNAYRDILGKVVSTSKVKGTARYMVDSDDFRQHGDAESSIEIKPKTKSYALNGSMMEEMETAFPKKWEKIKKRIEDGFYGVFKISLSDEEKTKVTKKTGLDLVEYKDVTDWALKIPGIIGYVVDDEVKRITNEKIDEIKNSFDKSLTEGLKSIRNNESERAKKAETEVIELTSMNRRLRNRFRASKAKAKTQSDISQKSVDFYKTHQKLYNEFDDSEFWEAEGVAVTEVDEERWVEAKNYKDLFMKLMPKEDTSIIKSLQDTISNLKSDKKRLNSEKESLQNKSETIKSNLIEYANFFKGTVELKGSYDDEEFWNSRGVSVLKKDGGRWISTDQLYEYLIGEDIGDRVGEKNKGDSIEIVEPIVKPIQEVKPTQEQDSSEIVTRIRKLRLTGTKPNVDDIKKKLGSIIDDSESTNTPSPKTLLYRISDEVRGYLGDDNNYDGKISGSTGKFVLEATPEEYTHLSQYYKLKQISVINRKLKPSSRNSTKKTSAPTQESSTIPVPTNAKRATRRIHVPREIGDKLIQEKQDWAVRLQETGDIRLTEDRKQYNMLLNEKTIQYLKGKGYLSKLSPQQL